MKGVDPSGVPFDGRQTLIKTVSSGFGGWG